MHDLCSATDYYPPNENTGMCTFASRRFSSGALQVNLMTIRRQHRRWVRKIKVIRVKRALQFSELGRDMDMGRVQTQGSDTVQVSHK